MNMIVYLVQLESLSQPTSVFQSLITLRKVSPGEFVNGRPPAAAVAVPINDKQHTQAQAHTGTGTGT